MLLLSDDLDNPCAAAGAAGPASAPPSPSPPSSPSSGSGGGGAAPLAAAPAAAPGAGADAAEQAADAAAGGVRQAPAFTAPHDYLGCADRTVRPPRRAAALRRVCWSGCAAARPALRPRRETTDAS